MTHYRNPYTGGPKPGPRVAKRDLLANPIKPDETWQDGRFVYRCVSVRDHVTKQGEPSLVSEWEGQCAECGQLFTFAKGAKLYHMPRRCALHTVGKGWAAVAPFKAATPFGDVPPPIVPVDDMEVRRRVLLTITDIRRALQRNGDPFGEAVASLMLQFYFVYLNDPETLRPGDDASEQDLRARYNECVREAQRFAAVPVTADDLL